MGKGKRKQIESNRIEWKRKREIESNRIEKKRKSEIESNRITMILCQTKYTHTHTHKQTSK